MSTRNSKTVTISLPPQLVAELDRMREREHRTRAEIPGEAPPIHQRSRARPDDAGRGRAAGG